MSYIPTLQDIKGTFSLICKKIIAIYFFAPNYSRFMASEQK